VVASSFRTEETRWDKNALLRNENNFAAASGGLAVSDSGNDILQRK
jgi:hypothetical protein